MGLVKSQLKTILEKATKQRNEFTEAIRQQDRLKFHSVPYISKNDTVRPITEFLNWVRTLLPKDKYLMFVSLVRFPLPTIELTERIFTELERVFDGRNPVTNYNFLDVTLRDDWEWYRSERLDEPNIWKTTGFQKMITSINSIVIVDLPEVQTGERPEPYFYWLEIKDVIDLGVNKDGSIDYIVFTREDEKSIYIFDNEYYRRAELDENTDKYILVNEASHDIGYCPASFFWNTNLTEKNTIVKKSPLSSQLYNIDWLLFFEISKKYLDLYAPYPIISAYKVNCNFENNEINSYCDGGYLRNKKSDMYVLQGDEVAKCPVCSSKRIVGVGTYVEVPVPKNTDAPNLLESVKITSVDGESLAYNVREVSRLKNDVFVGVVGSGGNVLEKESINESQVTGNFESKTSVLNKLKVNFEKIQEFVTNTICFLRYGKDQFIDSSISLGSEFYIVPVDELYKQYKDAKQNGSSEALLDSIEDQIIATENKNNPVMLQKMFILKHLEPYRHYTRDEVLNLYEKQLVDETLLKVKINFTTFVERFERENINIIEFGSKLQFDDKINIILNRLKDYANETVRSKAE